MLMSPHTVLFSACGYMQYEVVHVWIRQILSYRYPPIHTYKDEGGLSIKSFWLLKCLAAAFCVRVCVCACVRVSVCVCMTLLLSIFSR